MGHQIRPDRAEEKRGLGAGGHVYETEKYEQHRRAVRWWAVKKEGLITGRNYIRLDRTGKMGWVGGSKFQAFPTTVGRSWAVR